MNNGGLLIFGVAVGALVGAMLTEGNQPVTDAVAKSKKVIKKKVEAITGNNN
jgi:hypothetical protein